MSFSSKKVKDIVIESVEFSRATFKEAEDFKNLLAADIDKGNTKIIIDLFR